MRCSEFFNPFYFGCKGLSLILQIMWWLCKLCVVELIMRLLFLFHLNYRISLEWVFECRYYYCFPSQKNTLFRWFSSKLFSKKFVRDKVRPEKNRYKKSSFGKNSIWKKFVRQKVIFGVNAELQRMEENSNILRIRPAFHMPINNLAYFSNLLNWNGLKLGKKNLTISKCIISIIYYSTGIWLICTKRQYARSAVIKSKLMTYDGKNHNAHTENCKFSNAKYSCFSSKNFFSNLSYAWQTKKIYC